MRWCAIALLVSILSAASSAVACDRLIIKASEDPCLGQVAGAIAAIQQQATDRCMRLCLPPVTGGVRGDAEVIGRWMLLRWQATRPESRERKLDVNLGFAIAEFCGCK
jgi:hypothetical protein